MTCSELYSLFKTLNNQLKNPVLEKLSDPKPFFKKLIQYNDKLNIDQELINTLNSQPSKKELKLLFLAHQEELEDKIKQQFYFKINFIFKKSKFENPQLILPIFNG